jgi:hypothetical protein
MAAQALKKQGVDGRVKHGHDGGVGGRMGHWARWLVFVAHCLTASDLRTFTEFRMVATVALKCAGLLSLVIRAKALARNSCQIVSER